MERRATVYRPHSLFAQGVLKPNQPLAVSAQGTVLAEAPADAQVVELPGQVLMPGLVNAHSHAFQRALRGRTEFGAAGHASDDFWSWRELMYRTAEHLTPETLFDVSLQAFVEMAQAGITAVGEFHYLHHQPDGQPYDDEALLAKVVARAAREAGLRICLLRVGYARAGFEVAPNARQRRFIDSDVDTFIRRVESTRAALSADPLVTVGCAPHSVRAVPRAWLEQLAKAPRTAPFHMHVAEQPAELKACLAEHGQTPVAFLESLGLLDEHFTGVHAIHLSESEVQVLGRLRASVCACPSTERNLGDGIVRADELLGAGVNVCLGSDSQAHIDLFDEARQLEGHLRLLRLKRNVLDPGHGAPGGLGARLLGLASQSGATSLGLGRYDLSPGAPADFIAVDTAHPTLVGLDGESLLAGLGLYTPPSAVRDVWVQGRHLVQGGRHPKSETALRSFQRVMAAEYS